MQQPALSSLFQFIETQGAVVSHNFSREIIESLFTGGVRSQNFFIVVDRNNHTDVADAF